MWTEGTLECNINRRRMKNQEPRKWPWTRHATRSSSAATMAVVSPVTQSSLDGNASGEFSRNAISPFVYCLFLAYLWEKKLERSKWRQKNAHWMLFCFCMFVLPRRSRLGNIARKKEMTAPSWKRGEQITAGGDFDQKPMWNRAGRVTTKQPRSIVNTNRRPDRGVEAREAWQKYGRHERGNYERK